METGQGLSARLTRRVMMAGMLALPVCARAGAALPAPSPFERAFAGLRQCRREIIEASLAGRDLAGGRSSSWRMLEATTRLREAAKAEGLTRAQYEDAFRRALRLAREDCLGSQAALPPPKQGCISL